MVSVGSAYGAFGSVFSVDTPVEGEVSWGGGGGGVCSRSIVPSARLLERGTEPVRRTVSKPRVRRVKPREREK